MWTLILRPCSSGHLPAIVHGYASEEAARAAGEAALAGQQKGMFAHWQGFFDVIPGPER